MTASQFVGIDVAKKTLDVHILEGSRRFSLPYDAKGLKQLPQKLPDPQQTLVVVEATGGYHKRLVAELLEAGYAVSVVNPKRVRDYAKAHGYLAKTDKLDARVIALFAEHFRPLCEQKCSAQRAELEELVVRRRQLLALRTSENNRLETITAPSVRKSIQVIIDQLNKEINRIEKTILERVCVSKVGGKCWKIDADASDPWKSMGFLPGRLRWTRSN
jgi:transposase